MKEPSRSLTMRMLTASILSIALLADCAPALAKGQWLNNISRKDYLATTKMLDDNHIDSIKDYAKWLHENIRYKADDTARDKWSYPNETLASKSGDCEDFAFLNTTVADILGYETIPLAILNPFNNGHAISAFKKSSGKYYWICDNNKIKVTTAKTVGELAKYIFNKYRQCLYLAKINFEKKEYEICFKGTRYTSYFEVKEPFIMAIGTIKLSRR